MNQIDHTSVQNDFAQRVLLQLAVQTELSQEVEIVMTFAIANNCKVPLSL